MTFGWLLYFVFIEFLSSFAFAFSVVWSTVVFIWHFGEAVSFLRLSFRTGDEVK